MEKRITDRFCFAATNDTLANTLENLKDTNVEMYKYHSHYLFVVDTDNEAIIQETLSPEQLTKHRAERVYMKLPQGNDLDNHRKAYAWSGGKRIAMTLEIQNDPELLAEYKHVHLPENNWAQINKNMDTMGVVDMELYLLGFRVFLIMDVPIDFDLAKEGERWGKLPREQEWQNYVSRFQKTDPESKIEEKWQVMNQLNIP